MITNVRRRRFILRLGTIFHPRNIITVTNLIVITNVRRKAIYKLINGKFTIFRLWNLTEFTGVTIRWYFMDGISWTYHLWVCKSPFLLFIHIPKTGNCSWRNSSNKVLCKKPAGQIFSNIFKYSHLWLNRLWSQMQEEYALYSVLGRYYIHETS